MSRQPKLNKNNKMSDDEDDDCFCEEEEEEQKKQEENRKNRLLSVTEPRPVKIPDEAINYILKGLLK
jgi:TATA-binding protein-associated factor Taf7